MGLLDGVLGSVLGNLSGGAQPEGGAQPGAPSGGGDLLGSVLGGMAGGGANPLGSVLGGVLGGGQPSADGASGAAGGNKVMLLMAGLALLQRVGGLSGLQQLLSKAGLGGQVGSWIGQGDNQAVSGAEVSSAIGAEHMNSFASDAGIPSEQAGDTLAGLLPALVNHMTPNGAVPEQHQDLLSGALGALKGAMG